MVSDETLSILVILNLNLRSPEVTKLRFWVFRHRYHSYGHSLANRTLIFYMHGDLRYW